VDVGVEFLAQREAFAAKWLLVVRRTAPSRARGDAGIASSEDHGSQTCGRGGGGVASGARGTRSRAAFGHDTMET
jgi:hypothetical protein